MYDNPLTTQRKDLSSNNGDRSHWKRDFSIETHINNNQLSRKWSDLSSLPIHPTVFRNLLNLCFWYLSCNGNIRTCLSNSYSVHDIHRTVDNEQVSSGTKLDESS